MKIAIVGKDALSESVRHRLEQEGIEVTSLEANPQVLQEALSKQDFAYFLALDSDDETNLVLSALVKQLGMVKTIAALKKEVYKQEHEVDLERSFHVDHLVFPDLLVVDKIAEQIFDGGIYSRSFLHGNVQLATIQVTEGSFFAGKTVSQVREKYSDLLVCLIHRPHKILASSENQIQHLMGKSEELVFAHGRDLLLPEDEITLLGKTDAVLAACRHVVGERKVPRAVAIVGDNSIGRALKMRLEQHNVEVVLVAKSLPQDQLKDVDLFVACHEDEEHNFVVALQAKDHGVDRVLAVLSDSTTCEEADKLGIYHVSSMPASTSDRILELIQGGKVESVMTLYNARAEILQLSVTQDSSVIGIPLSILGPTLPKELLIGVIYTRGRIFIAGGAHILKPQDECLVISDPKHRALIEKII